MPNNVTNLPMENLIDVVGDELSRFNSIYDIWDVIELIEDEARKAWYDKSLLAQSVGQQAFPFASCSEGNLNKMPYKKRG